MKNKPVLIAHHIGFVDSLGEYLISLNNQGKFKGGRFSLFAHINGHALIMDNKPCREAPREFVYIDHSEGFPQVLRGFAFTPPSRPVGFCSAGDHTGAATVDDILQICTDYINNDRWAVEYNGQIIEGSMSTLIHTFDQLSTLDFKES